MTDQPISAAQFVEMLRKLTKEVEDLWIEKEAYRNFLSAYAIAVPELLKAAVEESLADPEARKQARERFRGMREALEQYGTARLS